MQSYKSPGYSNDAVHTNQMFKRLSNQPTNFMYQKSGKDPIEKDPNKHLRKFVTQMEGKRLIGKSDFSCPSLDIDYDAEWHEGTRMWFTLGIPSVSKNWRIYVKAKNLHHPLPSWKLTITKQGGNAWMIEPRQENNLPMDVSKIQWNQFAIISEKISHGVETTIQSVLYVELNEIGQQVFQCKMAFMETSNVKTPHQRRIRRQLVEVPGNNCSLFLSPSMAVARDAFCSIKSTVATCTGNVDDYGQLDVPRNTFYTQISGYDAHFCGIQTNKQVKCWGAKYVGTNGNRASPVSGTTFKGISTGGLHACGVLYSTSGGNCWGDNQYYQGTVPISTYAQISTGYLHTCGLTNDLSSIVCWGYCDNGECTNPSPFLSPPYASISLGNRYTCATNKDGQGRCWGNVNGNVPNNLRYKHIVASKSGQHTCGLLSNNTALCWGDPTIAALTPKNETFIYLRAGANHACGLTNNNIYLCWGLNTLLGLPIMNANVTIDATCLPTILDNSTSTDNTTVVLNSTSTGISLNFDTYKFKKIVSTGNQYGCGNDAQGAVYCWGPYSYVDPSVQLFTNSIQMTSSFMDSMTVCSLDSNSTVKCFTSQLDTVGNFIGDLYDPPSVKDIVQISGRGNHICGLRGNTKVLCWGTNLYGENIVPDDNYYYVAVGGYHSCAINLLFNVNCWGRNDSLQTRVPVGSKFHHLSLGVDYSCGIRLDDTLQCWGNNAYNKATPPMGVFRHISAGVSKTCAIYKQSYNVICWGINSYAPIGQYSTVSVGNGMTCGTSINGSTICIDDLNVLSPDVPAVVSSVDSAFVLQDDGIRNTTLFASALCTQLQWRIYPSNQCVQQANPIDGSVNSSYCYPASSYAAATSICTSNNGRLPTASETQWGIFNDLGCNLSNQNIWTETKCLLPDQTMGLKVYNQGLGTFQCVSANTPAFPVCVADINDPSFGNCTIGHKCEQNCATVSSSSDYACYCDDGFSINDDGLSCSLASAARSATTCGLLHWPTLSTGECIGTSCSPTPISFLNAGIYCGQSGARLPTIDEAISTNLTSTCGSTSIWTSTKCSWPLAQGYVVLSQTPSGDFIETCMDTSSVASASCIADSDIDECATGIATCTSGTCLNTEGSYTCICNTTSQMDANGTCEPTPITPSVASCTNLTWNVIPTLPICSEETSVSFLGQCGNITSYLDATTYCLNMGARLPTYSEMNNLALWPTACTSPMSIWTSTNCSTDCAPKVGKLTFNPFQTGNHNASCTSPSSSAMVYCVADN